MGATANATQTIYINGSTAFRAAANTAIQAVLGATHTPTATSNSDITKANVINWIGVPFNSTTINVKVCFYGSLSGTQSVSENYAWPFAADGATTANLSTTFVPPVTPNVNPNSTVYTDFQVPTIAFSDTYQSSTPFHTSSLTDDVVGIVPFQWVASYGCPTGLSLNTQLVNAIFTNGSTPLSTVAGASTSSTKTLFATGRDPDSGTRLTALAEAGIGVGTSLAQYQMLTKNGSNQVLTQDFWQAATINGIDYSAGNTGYASGGTLAGIMQLDLYTNFNGYYVTYLGRSDAKTALGTGGAGPAVLVAWNGLNYFTSATTWNDSLIINGQYTFFGLEHVLTHTLTGQAPTFKSQLLSTLVGTRAAHGDVSAVGISLFDMLVTRTADGGYITPGIY